MQSLFFDVSACLFLHLFVSVTLHLEQYTPTIFHFLVVVVRFVYCCVSMHDCKSYGCNCLFSALKPISSVLGVSAHSQNRPTCKQGFEHIDRSNSFSLLLYEGEFCAQNTNKWVKYCVDSRMHAALFFLAMKPVHLYIAFVLLFFSKNCSFLNEKHVSYFYTRWEHKLPMLQFWKIPCCQRYEMILWIQKKKDKHGLL